MARTPKPRGVAETLDRARAAVEAARAARDRSAEILLHRRTLRSEREPVEIDAAAEAMLRENLLK